MRVALSITRLAGGIMPDVAKATVRLLRRLGVCVDVPLRQSCCGHMHMNTGCPREALQLARNRASACEGYDDITSQSGIR